MDEFLNNLVFINECEYEYDPKHHIYVTGKETMRELYEWIIITMGKFKNTFVSINEYDVLRNIYWWGKYGE